MKKSVYPRLDLRKQTIALFTYEGSSKSKNQKYTSNGSSCCTLSCVTLF
ncbi:hypothetical protein SAMN04515674_10655 [Pseudarcicella hirudinis]|uniref:Uncharacterized protein n=1 Tax=Pseudarcicella hirudinis TaxID=1079859 RepID=A0A1I5THS6_9BACT|nr:hypothetical protein SAMN04515674_10655 [Pseudarcicella hirudinis]